MIIYAINYGFCIFGLETAMDFGSTKWNRCLVSGLSVGVGTIKNSPGFLGWIENGPCVL